MDLSELSGQECDQVWFVRDYVQIWFSNLGLTCMAPPTIRIGDRTHRFPEPGSRDALCLSIGCRVDSATVDARDRVEVRFTNGALLTVERDPEHPDWEIWDLVKRSW